MNIRRTKRWESNLPILIIGVSLTILLLLFGIFFYINIRSQNTRQLALKPLQEGKVYYISGEDTYFKLVDDNHFMMVSEKNIFDSDKELQEQSRETESIVEPELIVEEGEYQFKASKYYIQIQCTTTLTFSTIKNYQSKIYYDKKEEKSRSLPKNSQVPFIVRKDGRYKRKLVIKKGDGKKLVRYTSIILSKKTLPNSIDDFLAQYKYEPDKLD